MTNTEFLLRLRTLASEYNMLPYGKTVLCAVSGGLDSMVLLHALSGLQEDLGFTLTAAHYNHHLRGAESQRDEQFVKDYCEAQGIPLILGGGQVQEEAKRQGIGVEECARNLRYAFLEDAAAQAQAVRIATAHHADDNLETVLFRLVRGTGLRGLSGIPPVRGQIVRPLLQLSRQDIADYGALHGLSYVEDSSNEDVDYSRNYLRHEVLPLLRRMNPKLSESAAATIGSLREDQSFLMAKAMEIFREAHRAEDGFVIPTSRIAMVPRAMSVRVIQLMLEAIEAPAPEAAHIKAILDIAISGDPSGAVHLHGGVLVQRVYGDVLFAWSWDQEPLPPMETVAVNLDGITQPEDVPWRLHCREATCPDTVEDGCFYIPIGAVTGQLVLRARQQGDQLALPGRRTKSLKKLMIEEKTPRKIRERVPVLADERGLIAAAGFGPDRSRLAKPGEPAYALRFEGIEIKKKGS